MEALVQRHPRRVHGSMQEGHSGTSDDPKGKWNGISVYASRRIKFDSMNEEPPQGNSPRKLHSKRRTPKPLDLVWNVHCVRLWKQEGQGSPELNCRAHRSGLHHISLSLEHAEVQVRHSRRHAHTWHCPSPLLGLVCSHRSEGWVPAVVDLARGNKGIISPRDSVYQLLRVALHQRMGPSPRN